MQAKDSTTYPSANSMGCVQKESNQFPLTLPFSSFTLPFSHLSSELWRDQLLISIPLYLPCHYHNVFLCIAAKVQLLRNRNSMLSLFFLFFFFLRCWGLSPGPCACKASTLPTELSPQPSPALLMAFLILLFLSHLFVFSQPRLYHDL